MEVLPVVIGQSSVREEECQEDMKTFGTRGGDGKTRSLIHVLGKGFSLQTSNSL
jgi:hypothetical protein